MAGVPTTEQAREPNKLVLCFDGTGNQFSGSNADTNVVKILNKLDRHHPRQYHYYQTGIGTYDINEKSVNKSKLGKLRSSISQTIDQGFGTTFDAHVMAGYRFLMRYHVPGDKIYMFGFSRGAFTARFLSRMIHTVGLLCKGNEEMVPFAYRLYQRYLAGEIQDYKDKHHRFRPNRKQTKTSEKTAIESDSPPKGKADTSDAHCFEYGEALNEITAFSNTFCQKEHTERDDGEVEESNVKVYFLGIWDCVNSVSVLEREAPMPVPVMGTAHFIRHAVAVDECRVKFKPALVARDIRSSTQTFEDIKEVWFPGCHGDVGGGWPASADSPLDSNGQMTRRQLFINLLRTRKAQGATKDYRTDPFQLSDIPLAWMIHEVEMVGEKDASAAVRWCPSIGSFKQRFQENHEQALQGFMHHSLKFGYGASFFTVLLWKFMEWLPTTTRWELEENEWEKVRFPLNRGDTRDIPLDAVLHESLLWRLQHNDAYNPRNNHGGKLPPCLKHEGIIADLKRLPGEVNQSPRHQIYAFGKAGG